MPSPIRLAKLEDAPRLAEIYAPYCLRTAVSFEEKAPAADEMAQRIETLTQTFPWVVWEDNGCVAGYAYSSHHRDRAAYRWSVDASAYVDQAFHRQGIGRALYAGLFDLLRLQGFCRVHGGITLPNPASIGLHEAMGFQLVGIYRAVGYKMGKWHDVAWYQLDLLPDHAAPKEPQAISRMPKDLAFGIAKQNGVEP